MRLFAIVLALIILLPASFEAKSTSSASRSKSAGGSICIARVTPPNAGEKSLGNPSGGNRISVYSIQVDKKAPVIGLNDATVNISSLQTGKKHLIKIYGDDKLVESFWFRFESFSTKDLCLWFSSLYETWQLWDAKDGGSKCRCESRSR